MNARELHLARLRRGLGRIPELRGHDPLVDDPDFDAWRHEMIRSLDELLPNSNHGVAFANISFHDGAGSYNCHCRLPRKAGCDLEHMLTLQ